MYGSSRMASHWSGGIPRRPGPATGSTQPRLWPLDVRTREDRDLPLGEPSGVIPGLGTGFSNGFKYAPLFSGTSSQSSGRALLALLLPAPQPRVTGVRHGPSSKGGMYIVVRWATRVSAALQVFYLFLLFLPFPSYSEAPRSLHLQPRASGAAVAPAPSADRCAQLGKPAVQSTICSSAPVLQQAPAAWKQRCPPVPLDLCTLQRT